MAPVLVDKVYLPDLEPCLKGETAILSWKLVALALEDTTGHRQTSDSIVEFLTNAQIQTFFTKPATVFEAPTGDNDPYKQAFETRTSAVQVTPTPNDKYDIKTIKEDSLWLSKNARINHIAALRVVLVEFQARARNQLTGVFSSQDVANLQEAAGATISQMSNLLPGINLAGARDAADVQADFEKPDSRRRRIFTTYLAERRYFAMSTDYIFTLMLQEGLLSSPRNDSTTSIRSSFLQAFGLTSVTPQSEPPTKTYHALVSQYLTLAADIIKAGGDITTVAQDQNLHSEELQSLWTRTSLEEACHDMVVAFQLLDLANQVLVPAELLQQWFQFLGETSFLDQLDAVSPLMDLLRPIHCLLCVISLAMFNIPRVVAYFRGEADVDTQTEYLGSSDALGLVHQVVEAAAERNVPSAIPVAFGWIPVLHGMWTSYQERAEQRDTIQNQKAVETYESGTQMIPGAGRRSSAGSITTIDKTGYDDFLTNKQLERDIQPVQALAALATDDGLVFDLLVGMARCLGDGDDSPFTASAGSRMRQVLLELMKATCPYVQYSAETLATLDGILSAGHNYWSLDKPNKLSPDRDILTFALNDPILAASYFDQALNRFPLEFLPFIKLCRTLSNSQPAAVDDSHDTIIRILRETPTITLDAPVDTIGYDLVDEDENINAFRLQGDLALFTSGSSRKMDEEPFVIPAGSYGRLLIDGGSKSRIEYGHSALALLGKRLEVNLYPAAYKSVLPALDPEEVSEAIALLSTLVRTEALKASNQSGGTAGSEAGLAVVAEASQKLPRTKDIISVICDSMDIYLEYDPEPWVVAVISACVQFLHAILPLAPGRVWSYMARCSILSDGSRGGRLSRLTGTLELSTEQYELLLSVARLFSELVDSAMSSSVQRKSVTKSLSRQNPTDNVWLGVSDKIISQTLYSISQAVVDIFESSTTWRFSSDTTRTVLVGELVLIMNNAVLYTFSADDMPKQKKLTAPLEPAARYIIDSFLSPSAGNLRIQPLLATLVLASQGRETTLYANAYRALTKQAAAVLNLATTLVRFANFSDRSAPTIENQLFKASPFIARVCAAGDPFRTPAVSLLEALVISAGKTTGEPPSLLGYLGPETSRAFLQFLSTLDRPFNQVEEVGAIWRFLSTIVRNRQQWMASCLLTGKTPREARSGPGESSQASADSVLSSALGRLSSISSIPASESLSILDFLTSAQNFWPWTIFVLERNKECMAALRKFVRELKSSSVTSKMDAQQACNEARIAAYIAETFAMQLFHLRQIGTAGPLAKELAQDLDYFLRDGVLVSGYNNSLHANFAKNFNNQFPACSLTNFKRTLLEPRCVGKEYYYALSFANRTLSFDPGWLGPRNNGFKSEMEKANMNLSLVDSQIALFHAWEFLLLELSNCLPSNDTLKRQTLQVAEQCLEANQAIQGHEQIFERLTESRVDLALMLVQRVVDNTPSASDVAQLLNALWATVSRVEDPYIPGNIALYRTLLKLLYVTLRAQVRASSQTTKATSSAAAVSQTVLSILDRTVATGFRTLVSFIHDSEAYILPDDVAILTAIMQACLCIPGISQSQTQIVNIMAAHDAVHVAVSLYSWSDKLAQNGDPVYGELSLLFLLELSALPAVAEQLACDGLLNHLTTASMAKYLSRPNVSPYADTIGPQRCYSIWAKAIVPLLLNILTALGQTIAPEVAYVLNQFPNLMTASVDRFEAAGGSRMQSRNRTYITLLSVSEIHSLALMTRIIGVLRANNTRDIPEVEWDTAGLLENVEFWLGSRKLLRERLLPLGSREAEWKGMKPSEVGRTFGHESRLEEKVVDQLEAVRAVLSEELEG